MIARLRGEVAEVAEDRVCIDVHGVGYDVAVPSRVVASVAVGEVLTLHVHTHVREDAILLYGFTTSRDKAVFEQLIAISGIGPKLALACLSGMGTDDFARAVAGNDLRALSGISGVGKKTAERIVLELRGKISVAPAGAAGVTASVPAAPSSVNDPLALALLQLGYKRTEVDPVLVRVADAGLADAPLQTRVAAALRFLSGGAR